MIYTMYVINEQKKMLFINPLNIALALKTPSVLTCDCLHAGGENRLWRKHIHWPIHIATMKKEYTLTTFPRQQNHGEGDLNK